MSTTGEVGLTWGLQPAVLSLVHGLRNDKQPRAFSLTVPALVEEQLARRTVVAQSDGCGIIVLVHDRLPNRRHTAI